MRKKTLSLIMLIFSVCVITSCLNEPDYLDESPIAVNFWHPSNVYIYYVQSEASMKDVIVLGDTAKCGVHELTTWPLATCKPLDMKAYTDSMMNITYQKYQREVMYGCKSTGLNNYIFYDGSSKLNCYQLYIHCNGLAKDTIYLNHQGKSEQIITEYKYTVQDKRPYAEPRSISINGNVVWRKGMAPVGVAITKEK